MIKYKQHQQSNRPFPGFDVSTLLPHKKEHGEAEGNFLWEIGSGHDLKEETKMFSKH